MSECCGPAVVTPPRPEDDTSQIYKTISQRKENCLLSTNEKTEQGLGTGILKHALIHLNTSKGTENKA